MRFLVAIAILAVALTGAAGARAADLRSGLSARYVNYAPVGAIAAPQIVYDFEPGVIVRPYWLAPWRNRHYFPFGHDRWDRHKVHAWVRPRPAQSFHQYWSNAQAFVRPWPRYDRMPVQPYPQPPIFKK
jgi:hypothetical protein